MSDKRQKIERGAGFYPLIAGLFEKKEQAAILYDDQGITRANGLVTALYEKEGDYWFTLNGETEIRVNSLQAVNGLFASDYTEC